LLYQSEGIKNHSHPTWKSFNLQMKQIADNRNRLLEMSVIYRDEVDKLGFIGSFLTSYAKMKYGPGPENVYNVVNHKKLTKKGYTNSGKFELIKFIDVSFYSFLDYITSGTQLHLAVAFDFSMKQSVGTEAQARNEADLQLALRAIGGIIRDYSPNKLFPALGFGAKIPPAFHDSQEFFLNFDTDPCCRGIDGVLDAYRKASRTVVPIDKVTFFHVIHYVAKMAMNSGVKGLHYYVLTVFTQGGPIRDLKEVLNALVYASKAPLSVIFIGIGDGDFEDLCRLTSKHQSESGKKPEREIVEFLELNSVLERGGRAAHNKRRIAERALHVVPWHLVSFMHKNNIAAKPPIQISRSPVFHASYLIPDRPSRYDDDEYWIEGNRDAYHVRPKSSTPYHQRKLSDRSPAPRPNRANSAVDDSVDLWHVNGTYVSPTMSNYLNLRGTPFRSHSAIQTPRNEIQRRIAQRRAFRFEVQVIFL
uniref:Copine domain-containing protein n=1 Tax=Toxocara canis TaxID=6265 RepID=A0A183VBV8_TOXCA